MLANLVRNKTEEIEKIKEITFEPEELQESDIVENPDEVIVHFPIVSDIILEEKLPFFKSITMKLANL
jgi:hypothetical protein